MPSSRCSLAPVALLVMALGATALQLRPAGPTADFDLSAHWDFSQATVTQNNLGGLGPMGGEEVMLISHFAKKGDKLLDLEVSCPGEYRASRATANRLRGPFLQINSEPGWLNNLKLRILETGTNNPVTLERFVFTIWDLDHGKMEHARGHANGMEHVTVGPISNHWLHEQTTVNTTVAGKMYTFSSTTFGNKQDNPKDPYKLTHFQQTHAVTVEMTNVAHLDLHFEVYDGGGGRNLLLSGDSVLMLETPMPTPAPTPSPTTTGEGECSGYGDPHITSFDGMHYTALSNVAGDGDVGNFWLVKNKAVQIQAYFSPALEGSLFPMITAIAVGGEFLHGNTLIVLPMESGNIKWNKKTFLEGPGSGPRQESLDIPDGGRVSVTIDPSMLPVSPVTAFEQQRMMVVLPRGIRIRIDRNKNTLAFKIFMPPLVGGLDGQCGNFNGVAEDDSKGEIQGRFDCHVSAAESLFH